MSEPIQPSAALCHSATPSGDHSGLDGSSVPNAASPVSPHRLKVTPRRCYRKVAPRLANGSRIS